MIAWDWGYRQVLCNSDSMDTVRLVLEGNIEFHHFGAIFMDIKVLCNFHFVILREKAIPVQFSNQARSGGEQI
ncbi:hypothetical protein NC653_014525 [Populus alba x Populus x berolinensis]|uniref:RNase H type-1 domain-containing protein n=1 Tax=Populus alba x Populus x berolinensis TaxID=444605 RepID=A0AAD6QY84_9ROSI|nr:hypothetical protein NC653_014525 [Populus alba x Populus x berolinensis]